VSPHEICAGHRPGWFPGKVMKCGIKKWERAFAESVECDRQLQRVSVAKTVLFAQSRKRFERRNKRRAKSW
jgi:hypothetical protein